jgi:hypothetical protein
MFAPAEVIIEKTHHIPLYKFLLIAGALAAFGVVGIAAGHSIYGEHVISARTSAITTTTTGLPFTGPTAAPTTEVKYTPGTSTQTLGVVTAFAAAVSALCAVLTFGLGFYQLFSRRTVKPAT